MALSNAPWIMRGAFVEWGLSIPPLVVMFQFNPEELTRNRSLSFAPPNDASECQPAAGEGGGSRASREPKSLRDFHRENDDLTEIQKRQKVIVEEETMSFDIRLDATDKLEQGDPIAGQFGVLPQLSTLELMVHPKEESLLGAALGSLLGPPGGFSFTKQENPPLILFISGVKRVLPVNINSLGIKETEFSTMLDPTRATVSVNLTVIEGKNPFYTFTKVVKEVTSVLNLADVVADVVIPG